MNRTPAFVTGFALLMLFAVLEIVSVFGSGLGYAPPVSILAIGVVLGLITLGAGMPAWRGNRTALLAVVISRGVSAAAGILAFLDDTAPGWALFAVVMAMVLPAVAIWLVLPTLRNNSAVGATAQ